MLKFGKTILFILIVFLISCNTVDKKETENRLPLNSHEHKLLLNANKFENTENAFSEYWQIVKKIAIEQDLKVVEFENNLKQKHRVVHYYDTQYFDLRKKGFLIRKRTKLIGTHLDSTFTITFKFVDEEYDRAAITDLTLGEGYIPKDSVLVVEADFVNGKSEDSKPTIFYSAQNSIVLNEEPGETLADYAKIFPILVTLEIDLSEKLIPVNGIEAKEYGIKPGLVDFGNNLLGEVGISVREINGLKIPEFSFDHSMEGWKEIPEKNKKECEGFINHLQANAPDWFVEGKLKTAFVFEQ
jgi:hypothetical protein